MNNSKTCIQCSRSLPTTQFYLYKRDNYYDTRCKKCRNAYNQHWRHKNDPNNIYYKRKALIPQGKNICHRCNAIKPLSQFRKSKHVKAGYDNTCKQCYRKRDFASKLKRNYNMTVDEFNEMLDNQNGRCAICKVEVFNGIRDYAVDHCHDNGHVRGILCNRCNRALGLLNDNITILLSAVRYIKTKAGPV